MQTKLLTVVLLLGLVVSGHTKSFKKRSEDNGASNWLASEFGDPIGGLLGSMARDHHEDDEEDIFGSVNWDPPQDDIVCPEGQGQNDTGECVVCPAGHFKPDWSREDKCVPCPVGTYQDERGHSWCQDCGDCETTDNVGSSSKMQCYEKQDRLNTAFKSEVGLEIQLSGNLCGMEEMMLGVSDLGLYQFNLHECSVNEDDETTMVFSLSLPTKYAMEAYWAFSWVQAHREVLNSYIPLGQYYLEQIFEALNNAESLDFFGFDFDAEQLSIDDMEILAFEASISDQYCSDGFYEWEGRCVDATDYETASGEAIPAPNVGNYFYLISTVQNDGSICQDNAGVSSVRNVVNSFNYRSDAGWDCLENEDEHCDVSFVGCTYTDAESYVVMKLSMSYEGWSMGAFTNQLISFDDSDLQLEFYITSQGCGDMGAQISDDGRSINCARCPEGNFVGDDGQCWRCPFTTYQEGSSCSSCDILSETPFWESETEDMCIKVETKYEEGKDYVHMHDLAGRIKSSLDMEPSLNFCELGEVRFSFHQDVCSDYASIDELDFDSMEDDELPFEDLTEMVCFINAKVGEVIPWICGDDFDMTWEDAIEAVDLDDIGTLLDVACTVLDRFSYNVTEVSADATCGGMEDPEISMPIDFEMEVSVEDSSMAVPILTALENLVTMDFSSVKLAAEGAMGRFGMWDMEALTGLRFANYARDMVMSVPSGFSMRRFEFNPEFRSEDVFCGNGNAIRECWYEDWQCQSCPTADVDTHSGGNCPDECNNCEYTFAKWNYWESTPGEWEKELTECQGCQEFPDEIGDGYKLEGWGNGLNEQYYKCNDGFVMSECDNRASCSFDSGDSYMPYCEASNCELQDTIENGYRAYSSSDLDDWEASKFWSYPWCGEWVAYMCNDDFEIAEDSNKAYCEGNSAAVSFMPTCTEVCDFPDSIANGTLVETYTADNGKVYGKYQCDDEMKPNGVAHCMREDGNVWAEVPECISKYQCVFPEIDNGYISEQYDWGANYACNDNYKLEWDMSWLSCDQASGETYGEHPKCVWDHDDDGDDGNDDQRCEFPEFISGGYRTWEGEHEGNQYAVYNCYPSFAIVNNPMFENDWGMSFKEAYGLAACIDGGMPMMPTCQYPGEAGHCGLPEYIDNGQASWMDFSNETGNLMAHYYCNDGYMMMESSPGDGAGWCRDDFSMVVPWCVDQSDWYKLEFELEGGDQGNNGYAKARYVFSDGTMGDWETACNDGANDFAAGAVCRSLGWKHGRSVSPTRKWADPLEVPFGWSNVRCNYDDVYMESPDCSANRYDEDGVVPCSSDEQWAVECYDTQWSADVELTMNRNGKMKCIAELTKDDEVLNLKKRSFTAKFGAAWYEAGEMRTTEFEGLDYKVTKKLFKAKAGEYTDPAYCMYWCSVHYGDMFVGKASTADTC